MRERSIARRRSRVPFLASASARARTTTYLRRGTPREAREEPPAPNRPKRSVGREPARFFRFVVDAHEMHARRSEMTEGDGATAGERGICEIARWIRGTTRVRANFCKRADAAPSRRARDDRSRRLRSASFSLPRFERCGRSSTNCLPRRDSGSWYAAARPRLRGR